MWLRNVAEHKGLGEKSNNGWQSIEGCIRTNHTLTPIVITEIAIVMKTPPIDLHIHLNMDPNMVLNMWILNQFITCRQTKSLRPSRFCLKTQSKDYLPKNNRHIQRSTTRIQPMLTKKDISTTTIINQFPLKIPVETEVNELRTSKQELIALIFWFNHSHYLIHSLIDLLDFQWIDSCIQINLLMHHDCITIFMPLL